MEKIADVVMFDITTQSYLGMHFYPMTLYEQSAVNM